MIRVVVSFDVSSKRTYSSITKLLKTYGFRVQKSVYEIRAYKAEIDKLSQRLSEIINSGTDSVMIYNLGRDEGSNVIRLGKNKDTMESIIDRGYIII